MWANPIIQTLVSFLRIILLICLSIVLVSAQESRVRRVDSQPNSSAPPKPQVLDVIKVDSNLVSVPVIVSDREGRYIPNLPVQSFKLFDNSTEQKITYFDAAEEPLNIALLLDTSRSTEGVLDDIRKAAKNFLKELRPQDRAMIVSFDYAVHRLSDLTNDPKVLEKAIKNAKVGDTAGTALNDAVVQVARKDLHAVTGRKAIILLSDGKDFGSAVSGEELLAEQSESDTMVYSIYYKSNFGGGRSARGSFPAGLTGTFRRRSRSSNAGAQPSAQAAQRRQAWIRDGGEFLRELSEVTSGRFYQSEVTDLKKTFGLISEELRHQYRLGFYPGEIQKDGSLHQLRVDVSALDVAVRARQQYRAPKDQEQ